MLLNASAYDEMLHTDGFLFGAAKLTFWQCPPRILSMK